MLSLFLALSLSLSLSLSLTFSLVVFISPFSFPVAVSPSLSLSLSLALYFRPSPPDPGSCRLTLASPLSLCLCLVPPRRILGPAVISWLLMGPAANSKVPLGPPAGSSWVLAGPPGSSLLSLGHWGAPKTFWVLLIVLIPPGSLWVPPRGSQQDQAGWRRLGGPRRFRRIQRKTAKAIRRARRASTWARGVQTFLAFHVALGSLDACPTSLNHQNKPFLVRQARCGCSTATPH